MDAPSYPASVSAASAGGETPAERSARKAAKQERREKRERELERPPANRPAQALSAAAMELSIDWTLWKKPPHRDRTRWLHCHLAWMGDSTPPLPALDGSPQPTRPQSRASTSVFDSTSESACAGPGGCACVRRRPVRLRHRAGLLARSWQDSRGHLADWRRCAAKGRG
jgi:hypothetical protein